jgi:hypothetical protein
MEDTLRLCFVPGVVLSLRVGLLFAPIYAVVKRNATTVCQQFLCRDIQSLYIYNQ